MDREKAIQILKRCEAESHCGHYKRHYCCIGCGQREALDLAIEALRGDFHCPKCGTIVRDGRQYHDLVYRGEAEKLQLSEETSTNGTDIYDHSKSLIQNIKEGNGIPREITIQTGQTYGKSAYFKDIVEQIETHTDPKTETAETSTNIPTDSKRINQEKARQILASWLVSSKGTEEQRGYIEGWFDKEDEEAFRMAIEALSAPQTDLISRADAVMRDATAEERASVQRYIDSISAEAVQGEWIDTSEGTFCSECDFKTNEYYNFCPNCGCQMERADIRGDKE